MAQHPDAFSTTLDCTPCRLSSTSQNHSHHNDGTVNRLSRMYNQSMPSKPALPVKPPSLRTGSSTFRPPGPPQLSHASQSSVDPSPSQRMPKDEASIDEAPLSFNDIRARFQQDTQYKPIPSPTPRRLNGLSEHTAATSAKRTTTHQSYSSLVSQVASPPLQAVLTESKKPNEFGRTDNSSSKTHPRLALETEPASVVVSTPIVSARPSPPPPPPLRRPYSPSKNTFQSSTVSPLLHTPVVARTATGTSTGSASSQSSSHAANTSLKRNWSYNALSSWLSGQEQSPTQSIKDSITIVAKEPVTTPNDTDPGQPHQTVPFQVSLPVSPQLSGKDELSKQAKRDKVIQELIDTERVYQSDMHVLKSIYYDQAIASGALTSADVKVLFSNLVEILEMEDQFIARLDAQEDAVGAVFREMMDTIDQVYCGYCKRHEDAVLRLQELENQSDARAFLQQCQTEMQGKTASWDLGSLLIKPVQRVLKYPLLLREILNLTPKDHPDYQHLEAANVEIQYVADHINEIKRRKDIVEKIVGDKKKTEINVVHGINKKITRRAQRLKQVTGLSAGATQDSLFASLHSRFESQKETAQLLARDIQAWVRQLKHYFEMLHEFVESAEVLYASWGGVRVRSMQSIQDLNKAVTALSSLLTRDLDGLLHGYVYSQLEDFLRTFDNPGQVINKRAQKLLDYDRVRDIKSRGDTPDKALQESAQAYESINAQLVEELPRFLELAGKYFGIVVGNLAMAQSRFYQQMTQEWQKLVDKHCKDPSLNCILDRYVEAMSPAERLASQIITINPGEWHTVPGLLATSAEDMDSVRTMSSGSFVQEDNVRHAPSAAALHFTGRRPPHSGSNNSSISSNPWL